MKEGHIEQKAKERAINLWGIDEVFSEERKNCITDYIAGYNETKKVFKQKWNMPKRIVYLAIVQKLKILKKQKK